MKILAEMDKENPAIYDDGDSIGIVSESGAYVSIPKRLFVRAAAALIAEASLD